MLELSKVSFAYSLKSKKPYVLKNISLEISQGEYVSIIGPNASGKSTLAKLLNALLIPNEGTVIVEGMDTKDSRYKWDIRKNVGMVFQNPDNQLVGSSVEEEIAFGPENLGMPSNEIMHRVEEVLEIVGLKELRNRPPHSLSGGQKQRLAIASVLAMKPKYLVLDEATSMLDRTARQEIISTIKHINTKYGITIIHITHDMSEAADAQRIIVMYDGVIKMNGSPQTIFSQVEQLSKYGLAITGVSKFVNRLIKAGLPLSKNIINKEQLVKELCSLNLTR